MAYFALEVDHKTGSADQRRLQYPKRFFLKASDLGDAGKKVDGDSSYDIYDVGEDEDLYWTTIPHCYYRVAKYRPFEKNGRVWTILKKPD